MKRNTPAARGSLNRMASTSVYKRATATPLRGFWKGPKSREVFRPLNGHGFR